MGKRKPPLTPGDQRAIRIAREGGIVRPQQALVQQRRAGLDDYGLACAMLEQESAGGENVFGHDPVRSPQIVGGPVTEERYLRYLKLRRAGYGMQGVGPLQLTWYAYQDQADELGGCWRPYVNLFVGYSVLADLIRIYGLAGGVRRYNGSGPAAYAYAASVLARRLRWRRRFAKARRRARRR